MKIRISCSKYQIPTMRFIDTHEVTVDHLKTFHQGHIGALLKSGMIGVDANQMINLTKDGIELLHSYDQNSIGLERQHEADLTERVYSLISLHKVRTRKSNHAA